VCRCERVEAVDPGRPNGAQLITDLAPIAEGPGIPTQEMVGERALELTHAYVGELPASSYRILEWQYKCVCGPV
jgi:hypothetical protein